VTLLEIEIGYHCNPKSTFEQTCHTQKKSNMHLSQVHIAYLKLLTTFQSLQDPGHLTQQPITGMDLLHSKKLEHHSTGNFGVII
jgi:hypothetical protein